MFFRIWNLFLIHVTSENIWFLNVYTLSIFLYGCFVLVTYVTKWYNSYWMKYDYNEISVLGWSEKGSDWVSKKYN